MAAPRARFLVLLALFSAIWVARAQEHAIPLALSTLGPATVGITDAEGARLVTRQHGLQHLGQAPCTPLESSFDNERPAFPPSARAGEPIWFTQCKPQMRTHLALQRRRDATNGWAKIWGIVLGVAFGLVFLAVAACCTCCCCLPKRMRVRQARIHQRDPEDVATLELPAYRPRAPDGERQLEEAPAPDYHARHPHHVAPGYHLHNTARTPSEVPLPPSPIAAPPVAHFPSAPVAAHLPASPVTTRLPPSPAATNLPPSPSTAHLLPSPPATHSPPVSASASAQLPTDLPPAYSHAPP